VNAYHLQVNTVLHNLKIKLPINRSSSSGDSGPSKRKGGGDALQLYRFFKKKGRGGYLKTGATDLVIWLGKASHSC